MELWVGTGLIVLAVMVAGVLRTIYLQQPPRRRRSMAGTSATERLFETCYEQQLDSLNTHLRAQSALEAHRKGR